MSHPILFPVIKFGVRQATAFVGHSFLPEDEEIVGKLTDFFSKLGVICESGRKAEAVGISEKVRSRIKEAELFIGIFTRRDSIGDGKYTTSSWVVEEKSFALGQDKKILLFVEKGVQDIGGMQGDLEYVPFDRDNFGDALISAVDYILSVTSIPLQTSVEGNRINVSIKNPMTVDEQLKKLRDAREANPNDFGLVKAIADILEVQGDVSGATRELEGVKDRFQHSPEFVHHLGHFYERHGDLKKALHYYEKSIGLHSSNGKYYFCYAKCLFRKTTNIEKLSSKKPHLEKCSRYLDRAHTLADPNMKKEIDGFRFLIDETLKVSKSSSASDED
jgi:tetratricopeptide (TPR) repeat protein